MSVEGSCKTPDSQGWISPESSDSSGSSKGSGEHSLAPQSSQLASYPPPNDIPVLEVENLVDPDLANYPELLEDELFNEEEEAYLEANSSWQAQYIVLQDEGSHATNPYEHYDIRRDVINVLRRVYHERRLDNNGQEENNHRRMMEFLNHFPKYQREIGTYVMQFPEIIWMEILLSIIPDTLFWTPIKDIIWGDLEEYCMTELIAELKIHEQRRWAKEVRRELQERYQPMEEQGENEIEEDPEMEEEVSEGEEEEPMEEDNEGKSREEDEPEIISLDDYDEGSSVQSDASS